MKIRIAFTVDIDPEAWESTYGRTDTRDDVRSHAEHMVTEFYRDQMLLREESTS